MTLPANEQMIEEIAREFRNKYFNIENYNEHEEFLKSKLQQLSAAKDAEWQAKMDAEIEKAREIGWNMAIKQVLGLTDEEIIELENFHKSKIERPT